MAPIRICIVGREEDPIADHTEAVARARGHDVLRVPFGQLQAGAPASFDGSSWLFRGEELESCDGFVVRQYPAAHALLAAPETTETAKRWYELGMQQVERSSFALSALMDLEARGKRIVNPVLASSPYDHKPLQLATFHRAGLPIPDTVVTNFPEAARIFDDAVRSDGGETIVKPSAGGAEAMLLDDNVRAKLASIAPSPAIFQRRANGRDVRVTVVGGRVVSSVAIESSTLDYRTGEAYQRGDGRYVPVTLPRDVVEMSLHAASLCHHVLSGIDWKHDEKSDRWVLLEANSAPVYLDIEQKTGAPITEAIVHWLENGLEG